MHTRTRSPLAGATLPLILAALLASLAAPRPAAAATFTVTKTADTADGACTPGDCSLREAITAANQSIGADTILLPAGTYALTRAVPANGSSEDGNANGDLDITGPVTLSGAGAALTTISAAPANDRVLHLIAGSSTVAGVTITGGGGPGAFGAPSGGGIQVDPGAALTLGGSHVTANRAQFGAGIAAYGTVSLSAVTISANSGNTSGGIDMVRENQELPAPTLTAVNTTISGNSATFSAGGLGVFAGSATLSAVTITANTADSNADGGGTGGGIVVDDGQGASLAIDGSILAGNADASPADKAPDCAGTLLSRGYNLTQNEAGCAIVGVRAGDITAAPLLGPLTDNGGSVPTHAPLAGSPAIDAGDQLAPAGRCPTTDARALARPVDADGNAEARCDIGAVEVIPSDLAVVGSVDPGFVTFGMTLTYTAAVVNRGPQAIPVVTLQTVLPAGLVFQGASGSGWSCGVAGSSLTCLYTPLAAGASTAALQISTRAVSTTGDIATTIQLSAATQDSTPDDNSVTLTARRGHVAFMPGLTR